MNPEWLPVLAILLGGMFVCGAALQSFLARKAGRGLALSAAAFLMIAFAFFLAREHSTQVRAVPLTPASPATTTGSSDEEPDSTSMSLHLGDLIVKVVRSDRYAMSLDGRRFLELAMDRKGLWVTCDVGGSHVSGHIRRNRLRFPTEVIPRPDAHTLVLGIADAEPFRVRYADPRTIEVTGTFFAKDRDDPVIFRRGGGVYWTGGGGAAGSTLDLRHFGKGRIDFDKSGLVRIVP
jgi:hypothetical protein